HRPPRGHRLQVRSLARHRAYAEGAWLMPHDAAANQQQYATSDKLAARARLHQLYSRDAEPWFGFVARQASLRASERVLDIGCGPGWFWSHAAAIVPDGIDLT